MQRVTSLLLCVALTLSTFALTACNKDSIPLAQAGYQLHVYAHAGARVGNAFNVLKPEKLPNATYGRLLLALGTASEIGERVFKTIDASEQITPGDKVALIAQIDQYITVLDGVLGDNLITQLQPDTQVQLRRSIALGRSVANAIKIAIATLKTTKPVKNIRVQTDGIEPQQAREAATCAIGENDVQLAIALNGAALDVIRQNRMDKYAVTQSYLRDERARIGQ
jgi:hypothetical protein